MKKTKKTTNLDYSRVEVAVDSVARSEANVVIFFKIKG